MNEQLDNLVTLVSHPGWRLFREHVEREWGANGARYQAELDKALDLTDNEAAASQARQIRAGRKAIELLVNWPQDEIARLQRSERREEVGMSRRGSL